MEGDDLDDPVSDAARAILDGHIVLSRKLATKGHYPSIDVLQSVSRLKNEVASPEQVTASNKILESLAQYQDSEDLINIGAYNMGSNPKIDEAIKYNPVINKYLRQDMDDASPFSDTVESLFAISGALK